jgi:hypothetical protein
MAKGGQAHGQATTKAISIQLNKEYKVLMSNDCECQYQNRMADESSDST